MKIMYGANVYWKIREIKREEVFMLKRIKLLLSITFTIAISLLITNTVKVYAMPVNEDRTVVETGYTEEGIPYTIYNATVEKGISPFFVATAYHMIIIEYHGDVKPPNTYNFNGWVASLKTKCKGTLKRKDYYYTVSRRITSALYEGKVQGNI